LYIRSAILAIALHVLYFDVWHYPPHNLWVYMFYLTHWGHCINIWYLFCSVVCSFAHSQFGEDEDTQWDNTEKLPRLIKHTWSMYATAAPLSLAITMLYWTAIVPVAYGPETFSYVSLMEHGGVGLLVVCDGLWTGNVPLRAKQFVYLLGVCSAYLLWSIVNFVLELGNGEWPGYDDDALYPVLHWGMDSRRASAMLSGFLIVVLCPLLYWIVWMMSLASLDERYGRARYCHCCICPDKQIAFEGSKRSLLAESATCGLDQSMETAMYNEMGTYPTGQIA